MNKEIFRDLSFFLILDGFQKDILYLYTSGSSAMFELRESSH